MFEVDLLWIPSLILSLSISSGSVMKSWPRFNSSVVVLRCQAAIRDNEDTDIRVDSLVIENVVAAEDTEVAHAIPLSTGLSILDESCGKRGSPEAGCWQPLTIVMESSLQAEFNIHRL